MRRLSAQARRRGAHLIGADTPRNLAAAPGDLLDEIVALPVHDAIACRSAIEAQSRIDAVLTFREMCVETVAAVADKLGIAGNDPANVRQIRNKDLARDGLRAAGFAQPDSLLTAQPSEAVSFIEGTLGPWIVKPRAGMGSAGVSLVESADGLPDALSRLGTDGEFLVETFVKGLEFSAEGICLGDVPRVLAITEKFTGAGFVETGHRIPAELNELTVDRVLSTVERALRVLGIAHSIFHVEFWLTDTAIVIGELHARPGGDFIHALLEESRPGFELYGTLIDDLLGGANPLLPEQTRATGVEYLVLPAGRVRAIDGWDAVAQDPSVIGAHLEVRPGDEIGSVASSADRHGVIAVNGATRSEVDATLARLWKAVHVEVDHAPGGRHP